MARNDWQEIFDFMAANGNSPKAAADHFGLSINTVKAALRRAQNGTLYTRQGANAPSNTPSEGANAPSNTPSKGANAPSNAPSKGANAPSNTPSEGANAPLTDAQYLGAEPIDPAAPARATLHIKHPRAYVAQKVAEIIPQGLLYRRLESYVTVEPQPLAPKPATDKKRGTKAPRISPLRPMSDARFTTWIEQYIEWRQNAKEDAAVTSISEQQARFILASDHMRTATPEILEIAPVRLPIATKTGNKWHFEPAPVGLDPETGIFTIDSVPIDWGRRFTTPQVLHALDRIFSDFPLDGRDEAFNFGTSRSAAACVTAMLSQFLHHNIDKFPMILCLANQSGTGKSFLAETLLAPVHGPLQPDNFKEDEEEMRKTLNSLLFDGAMVCYLDDIKTLANNTINRFVTATAIRDRILGTNQSFTIPNRMQFFVTGNNLKTTPDIARRSLTIDLFWAGKASERQFEKPAVTEDSFSSPTWRADMLTALWSLCKAWEDAGCPQCCPNPPNSFKDFAVCAHITMYAGLANPFGPRQIELDSGDTMGEALETLVIAVADGIQAERNTAINADVHTGTSREFTVQELIDIADQQQILDIITNYNKESKRSFGTAMRKVKGRQFTDSFGRQFEVGSKHKRASNTYRFTILSEPTRDAPADSSGA